MFSCLTTVTSSFGTQCYGPSNSNAIVVKQKTSVPVLFMRIFGTTAVEVSSLATASMKGAVTSPYKHRDRRRYDGLNERHRFRFGQQLQ